MARTFNQGASGSPPATHRPAHSKLEGRSGAHGERGGGALCVERCGDWAFLVLVGLSRSRWLPQTAAARRRVGMARGMCQTCIWVCMAVVPVYDESIRPWTNRGLPSIIIHHTHDWAEQACLAGSVAASGGQGDEPPTSPAPALAPVAAANRRPGTPRMLPQGHMVPYRPLQGAVWCWAYICGAPGSRCSAHRTRWLKNSALPAVPRRVLARLQPACSAAVRLHIHGPSQSR